MHQAVVRAQVAGLRPDPQQAEDWLRTELAKPEYHPSLRERLLTWVNDLFDRIGHAGADLHGIGWPGIALIVIGLAALLALALARLRSSPSVAGGVAAVFDDVRRSAADHRRLAEAAYAEADWSSAVLEGLRWLAADLAERRIAPDDPGITTGEIAALARPRFPDHADRLEEAVRTFEEVRYGGRTADRGRADQVLEAVRAIAAATPAATATGPVLAVPR